jgi:hypothetical protein
MSAIASIEFRSLHRRIECSDKHTSFKTMGKKVTATVNDLNSQSILDSIEFISEHDYEFYKGRT